MLRKKDILKTELLGKILVDRKSITFIELEHALNIQRKEGGLIGEILVKLGYIKEHDIVVAMVIQCHVPYIAVDKYEIKADTIQLIPESLAIKYKVFPLDCVGNILSLVMLDPLDSSIKDDIQKQTKCQIAPFIATRTEINRAIKRWYGKSIE